MASSFIVTGHNFRHRISMGTFEYRNLILPLNIEGKGSPRFFPFGHCGFANCHVSLRSTIGEVTNNLNISIVFLQRFR